MVFLKALLSMGGIAYFEAAAICITICFICMVTAIALNITFFLLVMISETVEWLEPIVTKKRAWETTFKKSMIGLYRSIIWAKYRT